VLLEPIDYDAFCLPIYSTGRSILRNFKENLPLKAYGNTQNKKSSPRFEQVDDFFMLERLGNTTRAFPTIELSQILSKLLRGSEDELSLLTADALLFLSLRSSLPPPSESESELSKHWRADFQLLEKKAVDIICNTLARETASFYSRPLESEIPDARSKPVVLLKKVIGTIRRIKKTDFTATPSTRDKSIYIIESARILTERNGQQPTKPEVVEFMESKGWGMGKTHDGARKWKKAWIDSGLNSLQEKTRE